MQRSARSVCSFIVLTAIAVLHQTLSSHCIPESQAYFKARILSQCPNAVQHRPPFGNNTEFRRQDLTLPIKGSTEGLLLLHRLSRYNLQVLMLLYPYIAFDTVHKLPF